MLLAPCYTFALHFKICTSACQNSEMRAYLNFLKLYAIQVVLFCTGLTKIMIQIGKALTCVSSYVFWLSKNFSHMGWIFVFNMFKYCTANILLFLAFWSFHLKYASNFWNSNESNTFLWEIFCLSFSFSVWFEYHTEQVWTKWS